MSPHSLIMRIIAIDDRRTTVFKSDKESRFFIGYRFDIWKVFDMNRFDCCD